MLCLLVSGVLCCAQHVTCSSAAMWRCRQPVSPSASGAQQAARWPSACMAAAEGQSCRCATLAAGKQQSCHHASMWHKHSNHDADMLVAAPAQLRCS